MEQLSKYEYARIIGARSLQLSLGAPPTIKVAKKSTDYLDIAAQEFDKKTLPLSVLKA